MDIASASTSEGTGWGVPQPNAEPEPEWWRSLLINTLRASHEIYLLFNEGDKDYAHILWSKNLDSGDLPNHYPPNLEYEFEPGVMDKMNMTKLCRMQRSFRWQPHLPFMPVKLASHSFMQRYDYKYDTLPVIQNGPSWTLDPTVAKRWLSHITVFSDIIRSWRGNLATAPMSVKPVPSILDRDLYRHFPTERDTRNYIWAARTEIFSMFAEFSFLIAARPTWKDLWTKRLMEQGVRNVDPTWLNDIEKALGDFTQTKRAGVIIDIATTEIWPYIQRYQDNGVPALMDVGHVLFHDRDDMPSKPTICITRVTCPPKIPFDSPSYNELYESTEKFLTEHFPRRLGRPDDDDDPMSSFPPPSRPLVEEIGGTLHQRLPTCPWVNPITQEPTDWIQVAEPMPVIDSRPPLELGWVEFFDRRRQSNQRIEERETPVEKQRRESRTKDAEKCNQVHSSGPSNKSTVFQWVQDPQEPDLPAHLDWPPFWRRERVTRAQVPDVWDEFAVTQRIYDPFRNEWDLHILFDPDAQVLDDDYDDPEDVHMSTAPIPVDAAITFLDELDLVPHADAYSHVQSLSTQIAFFAPTQILLWAWHMFGYFATQLQLPLARYEATGKVIGFSPTNADKAMPEFARFEEFMYYIVNDSNHPRLAALSDLKTQHIRYLQVNNDDIEIVRTPLVHCFITYEANSKPVAKRVDRLAYFLTPKREVSGFQPAWKLAIFEATTVVQILRNGWALLSMEGLVRQLVRHGIQFHTLMPASQPIPEAIRKLNEAPYTFKLLGSMQKPILDAEDYAKYVELRTTILKSPHGKAAYRMGGIVWRLAMELTGDLDEIVDDILDGPTDMGSTRADYFQMGREKFYDDIIPYSIIDTICGCNGQNGRSYFPTPRTWSSKRWGPDGSKHGNLMWNIRDEQFFQNRQTECLAGSQPKSQTQWRNSFPKKSAVDNPFEDYCARFLAESGGITIR